MEPLSLEALIALRDAEAAKGHQFNVDVLDDIIALRRADENKDPVPHSPKGIE